MNFRSLFSLVVAAACLVPVATKAQVYEKVFSFTDARAADLARIGNLGAHSSAPLIQGSDGNLYGTTESGGSTKLGTIFKMTTQGALTTLVEFTGIGGAKNGGNPTAGLVEGSDGNFYGVTARGGAMANGTIFRMSPAGGLTTLVEFTGSGGANLGANPSGALVQGSDGNFYGTTQSGGSLFSGTVFRVTPSGALTTLVDFTGTSGGSKGATPVAGLTQGADGNFYGTTANGGASNRGTVFKITPGGVLTTLVEFTGNGLTNKGANPEAGLILGSDGNFYGTTSAGGGFSSGTVFKVTPGGALTTLAEFTGNGASNKGANPTGGLAEGGDGNFYGTTKAGGNAGKGTVFKMTPDGVLTTLVEFTGTEAPSPGFAPKASLVVASDGAFYGTTYGVAPSDGVENFGTVFRLAPTGVLTTLVNFRGTGASDKGANPEAGLAQGLDGNFYGTTRTGGALGKGTIFKLTPDRELTTLVAFSGNGATNKGSAPRVVVLGSDGNFYGTTTAGGASDLGTVFQMTPSGVLTTLVEFTGAGGNAKGANPFAGLVEGSDGSFYGTTGFGGGFSAGTVFKVTSAGALTTLVEFTSFGPTNKGSFPTGALVLGSDGNFYGTTQSGGASNKGTVFQMTAAGVLTTLVEFTGTTGLNPGASPAAALVEGGDSSFYGTTVSGGALDLGTVFKMTKQGAVTTLVEFTGTAGSNKGTGPTNAALLDGGDGNFYGVTPTGGAADLGTVFRVSPAGTLTTLMEFTEDGGPLGTLLRGVDGNLYGTTNGALAPTNRLDGTVYRLLFPGLPVVTLDSAATPGSVSAVVRAKVNPRGASTTVTLESGTDGTNFPNSKTVIAGLTNYQTKLVGTTLDALTPGTLYYYRFRAVNGVGTTLSPVQSFATLAEPAVTVSGATEIAPSSARFNGTVAARNFDTTVVFEWGTDGNSFPNTVPASPSLVTGNTATPVSAAVAGFSQGGTIYYRIRASSAGGEAIGGARSFSTVSVTTNVPAPEQIGVTDVVFKATIDTFGQTASVNFKYWADTAPEIIHETAPQTVKTNGPTEVSTTQPDLLENVTYSYRVNVEVADTRTEGAVVSFTTQVNQPPVAVPDVVFYTGQVKFEPLANDSDVNGGGLKLDSTLVSSPTVAAAVAKVSPDRLSISYNAQNNVAAEDSLTYRVLDPQGASATAQVRLIAFSKRAGFYSGQAEFNDGAVMRTGKVSLQFGATGAVTAAFFSWAGESYRLKGIFSQAGTLSRNIELTNLAGSTLTISLQLDADLPVIHGSVEERNASNVVVVSVPDFTLRLNVGTGGLPEAGMRTAFLTPPDDVASVMGDGYVILTVAANRRSARIVGQLPDGEPFALSSPAMGRGFLLSKVLEQGGGLAGLVRMVGGENDATGMLANLNWTKKASSRSRFYRSALSTQLELLGMKYPTVGKNAPPPIELGTGNPNARLRLSGGGLTSDLDFPIQIVGAAVSGVNPAQVELKLQPSQGTFSGRFRHPQTGKMIPFQGALRVGLDSELGQGRGVFRGATTAGSVRLTAP